MTSPTPRPTPPTPPFPPPGPWGPTAQPSDLRTALGLLDFLAACVAGWVVIAGALYAFYRLIEGVTQ